LNNCLDLARWTSDSALPRPTKLDWETLRCTAKNMEAAVAAFIRSNDITRRPTAGALPTRPHPAPPTGSRCNNMRHRAVSPAGSHPRRATHRSWRGPVTSPLEPVPPDAVAISEDLPPPNTQRWVVRRKAAVITAVRSGRITLEEALSRYNLTEEEYRSWERAFDEHGLHGLRSTRLQQYRGPRPAQRPRSRR
jgi:hypothetical protein